PDYRSAYYNLGYSYLSLNDLEKSIEAYKKGVKLYPDHFAYDVLGLVYKDSGQYEKAIDSYKEAIRIKADYFDAYENLTFAYHDLAQDDKAVDYLIEAININPELPEPRHALGSFYYFLGNMKTALGYLVDAQTLYVKSSNRTGEAIISYVIGEIYTNFGKDIYAFNNLNKALTVYEESNDLKGLAAVYSDYAILYLNLEDYSMALQYFQKALKIYKQLEDNISILRILSGITLVKFVIDDRLHDNYHETIKYAKQAIEFAQKTGLSNNFNVFGAYVSLSKAYFKSKDYDMALKYGETFFKIAQESNYKFAMALSSFLAGMAYEELGNYLQALDYLQKADNLSKDLDHPFFKWMMPWGFGRVAEKKGEVEEAKNQYIQAVNILEKIRVGRQSLASKMSIAAQATELYNDAILFFQKNGYKDEAFNYMERARSRSFLDLIGGKVKLQNIHADYKELIEKERQLQLKINYLSEKVRVISKGGEQDDISHKKALIRKELNRASGEYAELLKKITKDYPEISTLLRVETLNLKQVQALLDPDITLLQYFITPDETLLWIVDKSDLNVLEINIKSKELVLKVDAYREKIAKKYPDYKKEAEELYDLLIRPAKPYIKTKRIGIVPHSVLHYLPFQALIDKDNGTNFLIEEYEIFYTPSASVLKFVYEKRKKVTGKILAFGNPDLGNKKYDLPYAEEEVEKIKEIYPDTDIYMKSKATKEKLKKLSGDYNIIHFASHGELNSENPLFSSIRLAKDKDEDGRLEVHEIFNLNLKNTSLVTLSACETGLGKLTQGDELIGMTRGFIYAGTPSIVASLWSVNDRSTSELMGMFYKNLRNHSKAEALRMAQIEMIRGEVGKGIVRGVGGITTSKEAKSGTEPAMTVDGSHPYFWAPFILLGDWK
ncbi:MAG TPA: CHAT domain-containing protein, partial [Nitrospirae bacterium]|nr:CHAT domain-containing protein [Nitrospirota bacterium]